MKAVSGRSIGRALRLAMLATVAAFAGAGADAAPAGQGQHATKIVLLGTKGGPTADPQRSEPASLLVVDGKPFLIDAGDGVARQLAKAGYAPPAVRNVFITHHHLDHTAGLEPFMALTWIGTGLQGKPRPQVDIYGPPATHALVGAALDYISVSERIFRSGIPGLPTAPGMFVAHDIDHDGAAYHDDLVTVTAARNTHFQHPSSGPDGKRDMSFAYRFETPAGSVVFTGDTGPSDAVTALAKGADVLVSEVYVPRPGPLAGGSGPAQTQLGKQLAEHMALEHLSPDEVGKMAARAGVKTVILTHIVGPNSPELTQTIEDGVHKSFKGRVIVGTDLLEFELPGKKGS